MSAKPIARHSRRNAKPRVPSRGRANLALLHEASDAAIRRSAPPELADLPADFWDDAVPVIPEAKVPISLRVDGDVLAWFRDEGPRYQSRMNAVLRSYMESARRRSPDKKSRTRTD